MNNIFITLYEKLNNHQPVVLATILTRNGSAPRTAGAQMLVYSDGTIDGTIGGGLLEATSISLAMEVHQSKTALVREFILTGQDAATGDMICGGDQEVLVEYCDPANVELVAILSEIRSSIQGRKQAWWLTRIPLPNEPVSNVAHAFINQMGEMKCCGEFALCVSLEPKEATDLHPALEKSSPLLDLQGELIDLVAVREPALYQKSGYRYVIDPIDIYGTVYIFGGGHVSQKLALLTQLVGFRTVILDDRDEFITQERFPGADELVRIKHFDTALQSINLDPQSYMVIVTRGHVHDKTVLAQCLKTSAVYIGMIGSKAKREAVYQALINDGFTTDDLKKVASPIGLPIEAESPEEIAVSICAELIQQRARVLKGIPGR